MKVKLSDVKVKSRQSKFTAAAGSHIEKEQVGWQNVRSVLNGFIIISYDVFNRKDSEWTCKVCKLKEK